MSTGPQLEPNRSPQAFRSPSVESRSQSPRQPLKGASTTTVQISLNPKPSKLEPPKSSWDASIQPLELGEEIDNAKSFTLPPADEGFGAWSYVASAFSMFIVVWGFPQAFPIFQTYLSAGELAKHPDSVVLPLLAPGTQDILEGILFQIFPRHARFRRPLVICGICIMMLALILASYADTAWRIVLTQGVLFGVGGIMLNFVHVSIFSEWFIKIQGKAMGIIWLGWRVGSLAFPPICQWLLEKHGYEQTLRVLIAPMLALLAPSVLAFRGRYPSASVVTKPAIPSVSRLAALRAPGVVFYLVVVLLFSFIVNVPTMFIAKYGADLGLDMSVQGLAYFLRTASTMIGVYTFGLLSDKALHQQLMVVSGISTSIVYLVGWGFVKTRIGLYGYAIAIGLTTGGFANAMSGIYQEVAGDNRELFTTVHSMFSFVSGVAILSVGPVGTALIQVSPQVNRDDYAIGRYKYLVFYAGSMAMASGLLALLRIRLYKK